MRIAGGDALETQPRRIVAWLEREGWVRVGGGRHDKFVRPDRADSLIVVPRHREVTPGVAGDIAKKAGWAI